MNVKRECCCTFGDKLQMTTRRSITRRKRPLVPSALRVTSDAGLTRGESILRRHNPSLIWSTWKLAADFPPTSIVPPPPAPSPPPLAPARKIISSTKELRARKQIKRVPRESPGGKRSSSQFFWNLNCRALIRRHPSPPSSLLFSANHFDNCLLSFH